MIIECPNCNKKFNLDEKLIPENGRILKCGNCDHVWHYKIVLDKETDELETEKNDERADYETGIKLKMIFVYFVIFIISLLGLIFLLDTFKYNLSNIFPGIIPLLDSLYETLLDLKLFIKDLAD